MEVLLKSLTRFAMDEYDEGVSNPKLKLSCDERFDEWIAVAEAATMGVWILQGSPESVTDEEYKYLKLAAITAFRRAVVFGLPSTDDFKTKVDETVYAVFRNGENKGYSWAVQYTNSTNS